MNTPHQPSDPMTLPSIVAQIREQRPGVVPEWLSHNDGVWFDMRGCYTTHGMDESVAIAVLEAALWREYSLAGSGHRLIVVVVYPDGVAATVHPADGFLSHGTDPLALIRALCYALGIVLPEGGAS